MHMFTNCAMCICTFLRTCHRMSWKYLLSWRVKCKRFNPLTKGITYKVVWSDIEDWIGPVHFWRSNYLWTIHPRKLSWQWKTNHLKFEDTSPMKHGEFALSCFRGWGVTTWDNLPWIHGPSKPARVFPQKMQDIWCGTLGFWCLGRRRCIQDGERERSLGWNLFCWHNDIDDIEPTSEQKGKKTMSREGERQNLWLCQVVDTRLDGPVVWLHSFKTLGAGVLLLMGKKPVRVDMANTPIRILLVLFTKNCCRICFFPFNSVFLCRNHAQIIQHSVHHDVWVLKFVDSLKLTARIN